MYGTVTKIVILKEWTITEKYSGIYALSILTWRREYEL